MGSPASLREGQNVDYVVELRTVRTTTVSSLIIKVLHLTNKWRHCWHQGDRHMDLLLLLPGPLTIGYSLTVPRASAYGRALG